MADEATSGVEQRQEYRLEVLGEATWAPLGDDGPAGIPQPARVLDVSGGGLLLVRADRANPGDRLVVAFEVGGEPPEAFEFAVEVRSVEQPHEGGSFLCHSRFMGADRADRQRLIRWLFAEQVRRMERGVA